MTQRTACSNLYRRLAILLIVALLLPDQASAAPAETARVAPTETPAAASAVVYRVGSFSKATGAAPASQTVTHSLGAVPKALILWTAGQTADTVAAHYRYAMGFSDGTTSYAFAAASQDNVSPANASQRFAAKALTLVQWGETLVAEASLVSWNATTFTLNWTTNNNSATLIHYILIGGADVSAKVLNWQAPTAPGAKTVTGVGFRPDLVFHLNGTAGLTAAAPVTQPGAGYGFSLMNAAGEQGVIANIVNDAASSTPLAARGQRIDAALGATAITGASGEFVIQAGYSAMHSDGFTLNFSRVAGPMQIVSLALHRVHSKLGTFFAPMSGTPTQAVTGAGFQPELVLVTNWGISIFTAVLKDASHALGAADGTRQAVTSLLDEDRLATNTLTAQSTSRVVYKLAADGSVVNEAALSSLDSNGFTLNWQRTNAAFNQYVYLALAAPTAALIGDRVWEDRNLDGTPNAGEPGLTGVTVNLHNSTCAAATTAYRTAVTSADGYYAFTPLAAGTYCVRPDPATLPAGYALTTAAAARDVTLTAGQFHDATDFGYAPAAAADRLAVAAYAPCADAIWLQQIAQTYSATVTSQNPATCGYTVQTPPANQAALQTAIAAAPRTRRAEPDAWAYATFTPNDPDYADPWLVYGPRAIHADAAWDVTRGDPNVILAILDSGLDLTHPEFAGRIVPGYDFVNSDSDPTDDQQHGTHVTGIAAAGLHNGIGIAGIAGDARILPVKVLNAKGTGWWSDVARGITWAVDQGARVLNLSLAGTTYSQALYDAIAYANSKGAVVVAAAGNNGMSAPTYPASFEHVIAVGGSDYDGLRMALSNYGVNVDVMAPGDSIWSTYPPGGYGYMSGTSMAAPHAAGVAALLLSVNPNLTPAQIKDLLQTTATDMDAAGVDQYTGYGLINAGAAVAAVTPAVFVTPTTNLSATLAVDANANGLVDVGDTLRYLVTVANPGATPLANAVVSATVPLYANYVIGSTRLSGIPVRDDTMPKTALPLDEGGLNIGTVAPRGSALVSFDVVVGQLPREVYTVLGQATVTASGSPQVLQVVTPIAGTLLQAAVSHASAQIGQALTYTLTSTYLGRDPFSSVVVTAAVPVGTSYVAGSANAGGTLSSGTPSGGVFVPQPGTAGFDPGAAGSSGTVTATTTPGDTYIDQLNPDNNYEANLRVHVLPNVTGARQRIGLLKFDLSGVPAGARIDSATLTARLQRLTTTWDAHIYRLLTAWTETAATWNDADGTGPGDWASGAFSASDYDAAQPYGPLDVGVAAPPAVDVTGLARSWLESGLPNHGVALIGSAQNTNRAELYDSEDAGLEPKLTLNWSIPAEPATRAVLTAAPTSVNTGAAIQVSLALTATQTITGVTASLSPATLAGNATAACVHTSASPQNVNVGSTTTFTWDCAASGAGELRFTGAAAGTKAGAGYSFVQSTSNSVQVTPLSSDGVVTWNLGSNAAGVPGVSMGGSTVTIFASSDGFLNEAAKTTNRGACDRVFLEGSSGFVSRGLFKFDLSAIPAGATITSGTLYLYRILGTGNASVEVHRMTNDWAEGPGSCIGTTGVASNWNQRTSGTNWGTAGGDFSPTVEATTVSSSIATTYAWDIPGLIQGWVSGTYPNYGLLLKLADESVANQMTFATKEYATSANRARLVITYTTGGGSIAVSSSVAVSSSISQSSDDAEEAGPDATGDHSPGTMDRTSSDIEFTTDKDTSNDYSGGTQKIGLRFNTLNVPQGATITNATIALRAVAADAPNTNTGATSLTFRGQAADNPTTFTSAAWDITNRSTTAASVAWSPTNWTVGTDYNTPDLKTIVQEIVNRAGWASGNSMVFIVTGTGSRSAESWDNTGTTPARLMIEYKLPAGPALGNILATAPTLVTAGGLITVTQALTASENIANVAPATLTITGTNGVAATFISGPSPASATVGITNTTFTWIYQASSSTGNIGQLTFGGRAAGGSVTWPWAQTNSVIVHPPLTFSAVVTRTPPGGGPIRTTGFIRDAGAWLPLSASNTPTTGIFGSIGHRVWDDQDGDGIRDPGEPGLAGVTVQLTPSSGPARTATTDAAGAFEFGNLSAGLYTVSLITATVPPEYELLTTRYPVVINLRDGEDYNSADIGLKALGIAVGDTIWYDANANGLQDPGEPGIGNVTLNFHFDNGDGLFNPARDLLVDTTTSDANGAYRLTAPVDGVYFVNVTDEAGILAGLLHTVGPQSSADPSPALPLTRGQFNRDLDFGYVRLPATGSGVIGDLLWADGNGNGVRECWEPVLIGVTVCATPTAGGVASCTTSDSNGRYLLAAPAGEYTVAPGNIPAGLLPNTPSPLTVLLTPGQQQLAADFGFAASGVSLGGIGGTVWQDLPVDDVVDGIYTPASEPGIPEVSIGLIRDLDGDGVWVGTEPYIATLTTVAGIYLFDGLPAGAYLVRVTDARRVLRRFAVSVPGPLAASGADHHNKPQPYAVNLPPGGVNTTADFGYREYDAFATTDPPPPGIIGNLVWLDADADGQYDPEHGDLPLPGVTVALYAADGRLMMTTTTGADGTYLFTELPRATYAVRVSDAFGVLAGLIPTVASPAVGQDNTNRAQPYTVTLGLNPVTYLADFGYMPLAAVGGQVYYDREANGGADPGEPGIPGVTLELYHEGLPIARATTDAAGLYTFTAPAAAYSVTIAPAAWAAGGALYGWTPTELPAPAAVAAGQRLTTADFGLTIPSSYTVTQRLNTPDPLRPGAPISFTIRVTNTGATWLTTLPLTDVYSPTFLSYGAAGQFATPDSADHLDDGVLSWPNVLAAGAAAGGLAAAPHARPADAGSLAPGASTAITVWFTTRADTYEYNPLGAANRISVSAPLFDPDGAGPLPALTAATAPGAPTEQAATTYVRILSPTGLPITGFAATAEQGKVTLTWRTANEAQLVGFHLRRETADGASQPVTAALLPAQHAGANQGAAYALTDAPAPGAYTYVLEAVQADGQRVRAAAAPAQVAAPEAPRRLFLPLVVQTSP